jgi:uncharacterized membrane protein YczE
LMMGISSRPWARRHVSIRTARTGIEGTVLGAGFLLGGPIGLGTVAFMFGIGPLVQILLPRFDTRGLLTPSTISPVHSGNRQGESEK